MVNRKSKYTISYLKSVRLHTTRYLCGQPLLTNSNNVRVDKKGIPSALGPLKALVTEAQTDDKAFRFLMTLLSISRSIEGGHEDPDLGIIVTPNENFKEHNYDQIADKAIQNLGIDLDSQPPSFHDYHPSTKAGPNGQALVTCINDAHGLYYENYKVINMIQEVGQNASLGWAVELIADSIDLTKWCNALKLKPTTRLRKITTVLDPECKTRTIAILDY